MLALQFATATANLASFFWRAKCTETEGRSGKWPHRLLPAGLSGKRQGGSLSETRRAHGPLAATLEVRGLFLKKATMRRHFPSALIAFRSLHQKAGWES
jgi:hypothetical protein